MPVPSASGAYRGQASEASKGRVAAMASSGRAAGTTRKRQDVEGYWKANLRLITILLIIWFAVSYLPVFFVNQLNQITILTGFPLGYYMGSQGSLIVFVLLIFYYAWRMAKLDREYGFED
jgi:putative solute:sodium symporter small subunit